MNLSGLHTLAAGLSQQRMQKGGEACQRAYELLAQAKLSQFKDTKLLEGAVANFMAAIRHSRRDVDAYLGMGYVLLLLRDFARAERYLLTALRLNRQHPDVQVLLAELVARRKRPPLRTQQSMSLFQGQPQTSDQWDRLYDAVEAEIRQSVAAALAEPLPAASLKREQVAKLTQVLEQLQTGYAALSKQVRSLEAEFEIEALQNALRPLELLLRRMQDRLKVSQAFGNLAESMRRIRQGLQRDLQQLNQIQPQTLADFEARLESYSDSCDSFADLLDAWEAAGHPIAELLHDYEFLLALVESLQEKLDERSQDAESKA
ncbi:MAG: hypothetical protein CVV27_08260 [Candidatus Melainabacteria bacterium HGW-Melainabacteria-1]|nr:MAG: hypothetical protein CVV27_08260 [Candidatus Melainabacteria bacterium HGW-Melainabacteria-1]